MNEKQVEDVQASYVHTLELYEKAKRGKAAGAQALARFLNKALTDLRSISAEHSKILVELDAGESGIQIPALIKDILLVPENN